MTDDATIDCIQREKLAVPSEYDWVDVDELIEPADALTASAPKVARS